MSDEQARRPYRMVARAERLEQTRRAILEAMKEAIMTSPYPAIRVADVARAAGVSSQTVHTHFDSKETLFLTAIREIGEQLLEHRRHTVPGDVVGIVRDLVREYETYGDLNWWLLPLEPDLPAVAEALQGGRHGHRGWVEAAFAPLLPVDPASRRRAVDALYAATDVGTWKLLRRDLGLSRTRTRAAMEGLARGALAGDGDPPPEEG